ncbi:MAG TPA: DUF4956 domain-containing protein [Verrucomicrobia bacterium]|nr:DUF4956 domain-containing protein [Verrucomicrobiota bacterium]
MDKLQKYFDYFQSLGEQSVQMEMEGFVVNLILSAILSYLLSLVYLWCGSSLSNRAQFGRNFVMMSMTTMLIISIVKSSLALSLGLVGALSIVRFRAAIKEPEELCFLFLSVSIGLGFGAEQGLITIVAFAIIVGALVFKKIFSGSVQNPNLYLTVSSQVPEKIALEMILQTIDRTATSVMVKRFDESNQIMEASFQVTFKSVNQLVRCTHHLQELSKSIKVSYLDDQGIGI